MATAAPNHDRNKTAIISAHREVWALGSHASSPAAAGRSPPRRAVQQPRPSLPTR